MQDIRVLVVDDSPLMRELISDSLAQPGIVVVGTASDGRSALEQAAKLRPDVVTMDVQMPGMDGMAALAELLQRNPLPVIMVSSLTTRGATTTLDALDRGALDYVAKPEGMAGVDLAFREELTRKIRAVAGVNVRRVLEIRRERMARAATTPAVPHKALAPLEAGAVLGDKCVALGISTGGPPALAALFKELVPPLPPIVVVQHMPAQFTNAFAWRLNSLSNLDIKEAASGDVVQANHVYIAAGGQHLQVTTNRAGHITLQLFDAEPVSSHKPSVDVLMRSVAEIYGDRALGLIMTGMGRDGVEGCRRIRAAGGFVLGQDEATSDVYGMNKAAFVEGHVDRQFSLDDAARTLTEQIRRRWVRREAATAR